MKTLLPEIAILIPCYNEAKTIKNVVQSFQKKLPKAKIYVYDNNSSDGTDKIAREAGAVVRYEYRQGKGNVIRRMFLEVDADCYVLIDGDDTYSANNVDEMINMVLNKHVGDRLSSSYFQENKRPFHNFGNRIVRKLINILFRSDVKDIMTGYRAFSCDFVKTFPILSRGFEIETEMTIHALDKNMFIQNCVIQYRDRPKGSFSKLNTFKDGIKIIFTVLRLFAIYKPFRFWTAISLFLFLSALTFVLPVMIEYFKTGFVNRFPTLIVCGFTVIAAIQSFFSGMILQTHIYKNRQDFESNLQKLHLLSEAKNET